MKKKYRGLVVSAAGQKTVRVNVERHYRHAKYGKILRGDISCQTHDEENLCNVGDFVEIIESRPLSRHKRWCLVSVIQSSKIDN